MNWIKLVLALAGVLCLLLALLFRLARDSAEKMKDPVSQVRKLGFVSGGSFVLGVILFAAAADL